MKSKIYSIYKSLTELNAEDNNLTPYLNMLCNVNPSDITESENIIEKLFMLLLDICNNDNSKNVIQICSIFKIYIERSKISLTNPEKEILWLLNALNKHLELRQNILEVIYLILYHTTGSLPLNLSQQILCCQALKECGSTEKYTILVRKIIMKTLHLSNYAELYISVLMSNETFCEVILYCLKALRGILLEDFSSVTSLQIKQILSLVWTYMTFDSFNSRKVTPVELQPSEILLPFQPSPPKSKLSDKKKETIHRSYEDLMNNLNLPPPANLQWDNSHVVESCIRHAAICLLITITKNIDPSTIFQYWPYLIFPGSPSLRHVIRNDPSWCVRLVGLIALEELISSAKPFLVFAEKPRTAITSFTTLSETLGTTLQKLHDDFISQISDSNILIVKQCLRCISTLILCTPYQRISYSLILSVLSPIKSLINHPDQSVQLELLTVLQSSLLSNVSMTTFKSEVDWMFSIITESLTTGKGAVNVKIEYLNLLSSLGKNCFELILPQLESVAILLKTNMDDDNHTDIRLQAGRTVEVFGNVLQEHNNLEDTKKLITKNHCYTFWCELVPHIIKFLQDDQHIQLRTVGCDCLGCIDAHSFQTFNRSVQILIITSLFTCVKDTACSVRGGAIRALTRGILEGGRTDDPGLIVDIIQAILELINDSSLFVRTKTAWALSNLTDALFLNRKEGIDDIELSDKLYLKLLNAALERNEDNDKVKCNVIRAFGNLLRLFDSENLSKDELKLSVMKAVQALVKNITTGRDMKIKWNSCFALGSILKNENIYVLYNEWCSLVYPALLKLVLDCHNYKVRTNAVVALSSPIKRSYYGSYWISIWSGLLQVLDKCQNIEDFQEFKHRDKLVEQVCLTLAHLISLADFEDLQSANNTINLYFDVFKFFLSKCQDQIVPEKATVFTSAITNLTNLKTNANAQKNKIFIDHIIDIFNKETAECI